MKEKGSTLVNPIYDWLDTDIWEYIREKDIKTNPLYCRGYDRVGCIGCPLAPYHHRQKEFADYPQYKTLYLNAFREMLKTRKEKGLKEIWKDEQEVFDWWIEEGKHNVKGQLSLFD